MRKNEHKNSFKFFPKEKYVSTWWDIVMNFSSKILRILLFYHNSEKRNFLLFPTKKKPSGQLIFMNWCFYYKQNVNLPIIISFFKNIQNTKLKKYRSIEEAKKKLVFFWDLKSPHILFSFVWLISQRWRFTFLLIVKVVVFFFSSSSSHHVL